MIDVLLLTYLLTGPAIAIASFVGVVALSRKLDREMLASYPVDAPKLAPAPKSPEWYE